jgi:sulfatase maturation enzyme AslB (radical SAM superfamily)
MPAPDKRPETLCMAPWTHTYLSPQTERRMCCASREPAQNFEQYIDTASGSGEYQPISLEEHWNGSHMRSVRLRMMLGETLPECEVCNNKLLNTDVYRDYFNRLFGHKYEECVRATDRYGFTRVRPVSWDYRFSNLCNFKCRMCGDMLSSSWESEQRQHDMIDFTNSKNNWMRPEVREKISQFQDTQIEAEFALAVEQHRVEEVYWVGGEPLMYEQHWRYMKRIIELGDGPRVYARYNTNLSRVDYKGTNLYQDILAHVRDWQICASLDGTGATGEYIRTGLSYKSWLDNFRQGVAVAKNRRQMRIDFTLTLPGLFEIANIQRLADELGVDILAKVVFSFTPDIIMSPLALPRQLLDSTIDSLVNNLPAGALKDVLLQLKSRPTFAEQWPDTCQAGLAKGKARVLKLEQIRGDSYTMADILKSNPDIYDWYQAIAP